MKFLTDEVSPHYNVLVYGPGGTGKTGFGVSGPGPVLVLLSEQNGAHHIRDAAARLKLERSPEIMFVESLEDLRVVARALYSNNGTSETIEIGNRKMPRPRTVVLDQVSDIGRLIASELDKESPPKTGRDGLPARAKNWWNVLEDRSRGIIKVFRDAPCHTVFLAELSDVSSEDEKTQETKRSIGPAMPMKKLVPALVHAVSVVGITYRTYQDKKDPLTGNRLVDFGVMTVGPQYMVTKVLRPLNDVEVPDFSSWVRRLDGATEKVRTPELPAEMKEGVVVNEGKKDGGSDGVQA